MKTEQIIQPEALAVYRDINGVLYLRVTREAGKADFVVMKRFEVERISIDAETTKGLDLRPVNRASQSSLASRLLRPVSNCVTISLRAKHALEAVLRYKEIEKMETKTGGKFAKVTAPKSKGTATKKVAAETTNKSATKKADTKKSEPRGKAIVELKRMPKEGKDKLPKQAVAILETLEKKGGKLATDKLFAALEGKIETSQPIARIYAFYRKPLLAGGYIKLSAAS